MVDSWRRSQLQRLAHGYEVRRREKDALPAFEKFPQFASSQMALLHIFTDALKQAISPGTAAVRVSRWVLSVPDIDVCFDVDTAYGNMLGVLLHGARQLSSQEHLKTLADLTIELADLPDAANEHGTLWNLRKSPTHHKSLARPVESYGPPSPPSPNTSHPTSYTAPRNSSTPINPTRISYLCIAKQNRCTRISIPMLH